MNSPLVILGISGSLRRDSFNRATLRAAQELAPEGSKIETFELDGLPGFNQDDEGQPPAKVVELKQRIRGADAILERVSLTVTPGGPRDVTPPGTVVTFVSPKADFKIGRAHV